MVDVQRRPEELEGPLQALDGHVDPGAEASGIRQDDFHRVGPWSLVPGPGGRNRRGIAGSISMTGRSRRRPRSSTYRMTDGAGGKAESRGGRGGRIAGVAPIAAADAGGRAACDRLKPGTGVCYSSTGDGDREVAASGGADVTNRASGRSATDRQVERLIASMAAELVADATAGRPAPAGRRPDPRRAARRPARRRARPARRASRSRSAPSTSPSTATTWAGRRPGRCCAAPRSRSTSRAPTSSWWTTSCSPAGPSARP